MKPPPENGGTPEIEPGFWDALRFVAVVGCYFYVLWKVL
jgi:hypothetical protein